MIFCLLEIRAGNDLAHTELLSVAQLRVELSEMKNMVSPSDINITGCSGLDLRNYCLLSEVLCVMEIRAGNDLAHTELLSVAQLRVEWMET